MIIELTPNKIIPGAMTIWNQADSRADIVMNLKNLTFKEGSIDEIYTFHILDHFFPEEIEEALKNWEKCLKKGGKLYLVLDDFEYICRMFVGGDISIEYFNNNFTHPAYFDKDYLIKYLAKAGFREDLMVEWFADVPDKFKKRKFELVITAEKHD